MAVKLIDHERKYLMLKITSYEMFTAVNKIFYQQGVVYDLHIVAFLSIFEN